jgi:copper chaperone CopZ
MEVQVSQQPSTETVVSGAIRPLVRARLAVAGMDCERCSADVSRELSRLAGVARAHVSLARASAVVTYDPARTFPSRLLQAVASASRDGHRRFTAAIITVAPEATAFGEEAAADLERRDASGDGGSSPRLQRDRSRAERTACGLLVRLETTPGWLLALLHHVLRSPRGRAILATSPDLPPAVLTELARDPDDEVRQAVAGNPATPPGALADLAWQWPCRWAVAANVATPEPLLAHVSSDWDPAVRAAVARNPGAPAEVLACLETDHHRAVRDGATRNASRSVACEAKGRCPA